MEKAKAGSNLSGDSIGGTKSNGASGFAYTLYVVSAKSSIKSNPEKKYVQE